MSKREPSRHEIAQAKLVEQQKKDFEARSQRAKDAAERTRQNHAQATQLRRQAEARAHSVHQASVKKSEADKAKAAADCMHKHMKFSAAGRKIICIDCDRTWDAGPEYFNPKLSELDTRHDRFSIARTKKLG